LAVYFAFNALGWANRETISLSIDIFRIYTELFLLVWDTGLVQWVCCILFTGAAILVFASHSLPNLMIPQVFIDWKVEWQPLVGSPPEVTE